MTGRIPAIETRAYGCRFRSRLEARWAVFLTEAGFTWEYEPEGAELDAGRYLCDFRVTGPNGVQVWLEIKPPVDTVDDPRWAELAARSGMMLFTVRGMHRRGDRCETAHSCRVCCRTGRWPTCTGCGRARDTSTHGTGRVRHGSTARTGWGTHPAGDRSVGAAVVGSREPEA